jgi:lysyl oxidase
VTKLAAVGPFAFMAMLAVAPARGPDAPLPNLVELPPSSLEVQSVGGRSLLRFTSTVENRGRSALVVVSTRPEPGASFSSVQVLGSGRVPLRVALAYRRSGGHDHFHLRGFQRYELRDALGRLIARDHKVGYCLGDRRPVGGSRARWTGSCGRGRPRALRIAQGLSPGFADPYASDLGGQTFDVTALPAGDYELSNAVNPARGLRESAYDDDAASVRFVLARPPAPAGIAFVQVLATCRTARCPG